MNVSELNSTSSAYDAMQPYWDKVEAIRGGTETMQAAARSMNFLPRLPKESAELYKWRVDTATFTDLFSDICDSLASKPFEKEVVVGDNAGKVFLDFAEDVDSSGSHVSIFAGEWFLGGILNAIEWVLVDFPQMHAGATLADISGAKPYWVRIPANAMLMAKTAVVNGKVEIVYAKIKESQIVNGDDGGIKEVQQWRIFKRDFDKDGFGWGRPYFEIWQADDNDLEAKLVANSNLGIDSIPLVPLVIGEQENDQFQVRPPMRNLADKQVEYFQKENNLNHIETQSAFPMYVGLGLDQPQDAEGKPATGVVGASTVIWTGRTPEGFATPDFKIIEPSGTTLAHLEKRLAATETQMRELGKMPMIAGTAGITQVAAAFASKKSSALIQIWAARLKDALENAMIFTAMWMGQRGVEPEIHVHTDFSVEIADADAPRILLDSYNAGLISRETYLSELKRRGILSPNFDLETDSEAILKETPTDDSENEFEVVQNISANANL